MIRQPELVCWHAGVRRMADAGYAGNKDHTYRPQQRHVLGVRAPGGQSAALLVVPPDGEPWQARVDLRVEDHRDPLTELRRLYRLQRAYETLRAQCDGDAREFANARCDARRRNGNAIRDDVQAVRVAHHLQRFHQRFSVGRVNSLI